MAAVALDNLVKIYENGLRVVDGLNLDIHDREFVVLVGPSGCGKSTTLRMIAGLEEISSGTIRIGNRIVNDTPPKDRDIAMVFQSYALYPHMTCYENMAFSLKLRGTPKPVIAEKIKKAAQTLMIEHLLERKPKALSGGQRQRVALGRAIVREPQCFLFDEPLSNLDAKLRVEMRAEIKQLHQRLQATTVYVTHDQEEAMTLGDRVVVMHRGVVQQCASALDVYHRPANRYVAGFLGSPPMNFFEGRIVKEGDELYFDEGTGKLRVAASGRQALLPYVGESLVMGIRPEAISCGPTEQVSSGATLVMGVDLVQTLGHQLHLYLSTSKHPKTIASVGAFHRFSPGEGLAMVFDMDRAHFFERGEVGRNLLTVRGPQPGRA